MNIAYIFGIIAATIASFAGFGWFVSTVQEKDEPAETMWSSPDYSNTATYSTLRTSEFDSFITTYNRDYTSGSAEYQYRLEWFSENYEWI